MKDNKEQTPSIVAAMPEPYRDGVNDRSRMGEDCGANGEGARPRHAKKPYGKPSFRYERVFETMALSCGKVSPVEFQCRFNRKNS